MLLAPEYQHRKLSLKERSMSVFQRSKFPFFDFRVHLDTPAAIHVVQPIVCYVRLELSPETSTAPYIPYFTLKRISLRIDAKSTFHGTKLLGERSEEQVRPGKRNGKIWVFSCPKQGMRRPLRPTPVFCRPSPLSVSKGPVF